ncbi:MAG: right-handed parallel beta-helix repeat-containing protein [Chloroflexi bacterium]|nr:right-handed parallel beta-helix repeat-containing protein [Chloroflexota bacterium]
MPMFVRALHPLLLFVMFAIALVWSTSAFAASAATFTVNATDDVVNGGGCDAAHCSLREAINASNASVGVQDTIRFKIKKAGNLNCNSATGVCQIMLASALPTLGDSVIIDGYSQPGASPNTLNLGNDAKIKIVLDCNLLNINGLTLNANTSTIKGLSIVRCNGNGISVLGDTNALEGNFIGLAPDGSQQANTTGIQVLSASTNRIGGIPVARNIISGNNGAGISVINSPLTVIQGNYIGASPQGTAALGNGGDGVFLSGSDLCTLGGQGVQARNVIAANGGEGIGLGNGSDNNLISGNFIGVGANGKISLGNQNGIFISGAFSQSGPKSNTIMKNRIGNNSGAGIWIQDVTNTYSTDNAFSSNSIFSNGALGIDLRAPGASGNDPGDGDTGENGMQNYPVLNSAKKTATGATIKGALNSKANGTYQLEFFAAAACDASGNGEGKKFLGKLNVTADASGNASFTFKTTKKVKQGQAVTATATEVVSSDLRSTSEFSQCRTLQ